MNELLRLDDLTYAQLVEEARARIPTLTPEWTDHNPSDPGIALAELFAWLVEMVLYRVSRVPDDNYRVFLSLLKGTKPQYDDPRSIEVAIRETLLELRRPYRAVTENDYENLLLYELPRVAKEEQHSWSSGTVRRVRCLPERDLEHESATDRVGHVSVVLLLAPPAQRLSSEDLAFVERFLDQRRLVGTKVHVISPPRPASITVSAQLFLEADALYQPNQLNRTPVPLVATQAIEKFLDPFAGGHDGKGWPLGRPLYVSDVTLVLAGVEGVEAVDQVRLGLNGAPPQEADLDVFEFEVLTLAKETKFTTLVREGITWIRTKEPR